MRRMWKSWEPLAALALSAVAGLALACEEPARVRNLCVRDLERIDEARACRADEDCPCGAACELGRCVAQCRSDADCSGGWCDDFGRCRDAADESLVPPLQRALETRLRFSSTLVRISDPASPRSFDVIVDRMPSGAPVRVEAGPGIAVRCGDSGDFARSCVERVQADAPVLRVWVRGDETMGRHGDVVVYAGETVGTVGVTTAPVDDRPAPTVDALVSGEYEGIATLVAQGVGEDAAVGGDVSGGMVLPVTARVFAPSGGAGTIVLVDNRGVLHPGGSWVGRIEGGGTTSIDFPSATYIQSDAWAGMPIEIVADALPATVRLRGESLSFELPIRFVGVFDGPRVPFLRWSVTLSRVRELPSDARAPTVPGDRVSPLTSDRAYVPTPWEGAIRAAIGEEDLARASRERLREVLASYRLRSEGGGGSLSACTVRASDLDALGRVALEDAWGAGAAPGAAPLLSPSLEERLAGTFLVMGFSMEPRVTLTSSVRARQVPCDATFIAVATGSTCAPSTRYRLGRINICDAMAAAYGCEVVDAPAGATIQAAVEGSLTSTSPGGCEETLPATTVTATLARVCRLPPVAQACGEMALCYQVPASGPADFDRSSLEAARFSDEVLELSGDLACEGGSGALFALDRNLELAPCPPESPACDRLGALEIAERCAAEILRIRESAPPSSPGLYAHGLRTLLSHSAQCVDAARWLFALGLATEADRRRATDRNAPATELASRVGLRLWQRMLHQGAMIAREAAQRELMGEMFRHRSSGRRIPTPEQTLAVVDPIWDLLLHPRFATALLQVPDSVLANPDYRPIALSRALEGAPHHEQTAGLPVAMVDLLNAQLALLEPRLEWAALDRDRSALDVLGRQLRYALVVRAIAGEATGRARALGALRWSDRFDAAQTELDARLARLGLRADAIATGTNPLGIEEEDLPLYFLGDEDTAATRFSAISDFLIGQMPGSVISGSAWAPALVQIARDAWDDALPLFIEQIDRQIQVRQSEAELESRLEEIRLDFGTRLAELCYPDDLATRDLLERWDFDERTCFYRSTRRECLIDPSAYANVLTPSQLRFHMCLVGEVRRAVGESISFGVPALDRLADRFDACRAPRYPVDCPLGVSGMTCIECDVGGETIAAPLSPDQFRAVLGAAYLPARLLEDLQNICLERYPGSDPSLPSPEDVPDSPVLRRDCYNGAIGEAIFDLRSREVEMEAARTDFESARARYDIAMRSCAIQHLGAEQASILMAQHDETMRHLEGVKLGLDIASHVADAAADCTEVFADVDLLKAIGSGGAAPVLAGLTCAARAVSHAMQAAITGIENDMEAATRAHERALAALEAQTEFDVCVNDAAIELVDQRAAILRMKQASIELEAAQYRIREMQVAARTLYEDGRAALEATRARFVPPLTHDFWVGSQATRFWRDMQLARRVTYLAVRAVEYELQQTLAQRDAVLRARHPDELWSVLNDLWTMTGVRTIRGNRPTDLKVVVSLRDHLLQLADRSGWDPAEHAYDEVTRFRLLLTAPEYAMFDRDGRYLGQRIPFQIAPLGAIQLGQTAGIPVLAGSDCAERLWSVNASVVGRDVFRQRRGSSAPTFVRIDLLKRNTFYSQWCDARSSATPFQVASVRPSRNLFRDPVFGSGGIARALGLTNEATLESRARIEAYFNIEREEFERDEYANGSTSELAARGLYGEYALFIPADVLSIDGSDGLVLENVEDILLRLDYVSVAR